MGKNVDLFEKKFAEYIGSKYAIMVNSGSSANLLAMAVASNYLRKNKLNKGDKVIVPNICWSTSVWPIIQMGLVPVFVDVDPYTLNMDINDLKRIISENNDIKGIVAVHILGNCTDMDELMKIVKENNLFLMEDTCESLGSTFKGKKLGNFGDFGTYSFYYSHHITTIEGGMVVCNNDEDYELLKCLRAHGWTRYLNNKTEIEQEYKDVDNRFLFVNVGYNFRPMETQGAMGIVQLKKLDEKNSNRNYNFHSLMNAFTNHEKFNDQFEFIHAQNNSDPAWFSFPVILNEKYESNYNDFLSYLSKNNIENRPVVTGNFVRQPIFKLMNLEQKYNADDFKGGEIIHKRGFFIGLPCEKLSDEDILTVANIFMNYDF
jgi:CDP-6-deoxy-D-xylo-4-hexulose-3-dehydrase